MNPTPEQLIDFQAYLLLRDNEPTSLKLLTHLQQRDLKAISALATEIMQEDTPHFHMIATDLRKAVAKIAARQLEEVGGIEIQE